MLDPLLTPGIASKAPLAAVREGAAPSADSDALARGARFQTLLEELELRAREVARSAQGPLSAESLPDAVQNARQSLEGALQLSQDLLEACRQSATQATARKEARA